MTLSSQMETKDFTPSFSQMFTKKRMALTVRIYIVVFGGGGEAQQGAGGCRHGPSTTTTSKGGGRQELDTPVPTCTIRLPLQPPLLLPKFANATHFAIR
mmetsp:Transcript_21377/g.52620  ORF Transcript_21377/g.52620 Transcript_21377/m.52620 type:complete len:99 (+) Transcript_21377:647-943(+)